MKQLFFVAVAGGFFSITGPAAKAQANVNIESMASKAGPAKSPKFIEGIEIVPGAISNTEISVEENQPVGGLPVSRPATLKGVFTGAIETSNSLQFKYSMMMDREVESITNIPLYQFIDLWWATPYQYGGTDSNGIDCSAFTAKLLSVVYGINVPRTAKEQFAMCEKRRATELVEGDLVFFDTRGGISHVGLYLGNNYFVHSSVHEGVTISSLMDDYYGKNFVSGGRIVF